MERQRFREEERMRKVQMQEERELKKELDKTEPAKEKHKGWLFLGCSGAVYLLLKAGFIFGIL